MKNKSTYQAFSKTCSRCKIERTINSFYPDKRAPDGHATICRSCITTGRKITRGNRTTGASSNFTVLHCPCEMARGCLSYIECAVKKLACPSFGGWVNDGKRNGLSRKPTNAEFKRLFPDDRLKSNSKTV